MPGSERAAALSSPRPRFARARVPPAFSRLLQTEFSAVQIEMGEAEAQEDVAQDRGEARHKAQASNAANAACGSCFNLNTVRLDKPSALAMADRLGGAGAIESKADAVERRPRLAMTDATSASTSAVMVDFERLDAVSDQRRRDRLPTGAFASTAGCGCGPLRSFGLSGRPPTTQQMRVLTASDSP
jgi:hypothetical protein